MTDAGIERVRAQFESLMLEPLLQPLEQAFGGYGEIATQAFSEALAKAMTP